VATLYSKLQHDKAANRPIVRSMGMHWVTA
jgi:hypothetical protein